ncbi:MAG: exosortase/archaeosortase family protein [Phycisphaerales bacterium JB063]
MPDTRLSNKDGWTAGRIGCALALGAAAVLSVRGAWLDIAHIAWVDEESSQIWLVVPIMLLLLGVRRDKLRAVFPAASFYGTLLVVAGWGLSWYGYFNAIQSLWHLGAVVLLIGAVWTALGTRVMIKALPAVMVALFFVPVPGRIRSEIAMPMQQATAIAAEAILIIFGQNVERTGMMLSFNGKAVVRIDEACNGMRMVFALLLVCYGYAMATPLKGYVRFLVIGLSPALAVACNIIRVVPTALVYAHADQGTGDLVHDLSGWAMVFLAYGFLMGVFALLEWAEVPVMQGDGEPAALPAAPPAQATAPSPQRTTTPPVRPRLSDEGGAA